MNVPEQAKASRQSTKASFIHVISCELQPQMVQLNNNKRNTSQMYPTAWLLVDFWCGEIGNRKEVSRPVPSIRSGWAVEFTWAIEGFSWWCASCTGLFPKRCRNGSYFQKGRLQVSVSLLQMWGAWRGLQGALQLQVAIECFCRISMLCVEGVCACPGDLTEGTTSVRS